MNISNPMIRCAKITGSPHIPPINKLSTLGKAKFILEQSIWIEFLKIIQNMSKTISDKRPMIDEFIAHVEQLKLAYQNVPVSASPGEKELYQIMIQASQNLKDTPAATIEGLLNYSTPDDDRLDVRNVLGPKEAYHPMLYQIGVTFPKDWYPEGYIPNAFILTPNTYTDDLSDKPDLCLGFDLTKTLSYDFHYWDNANKSLYDASPKLFKYLFRFNLSNWNFDSLCAIISNYVIEKCFYLYPTDRNDTLIISFPDACHNAVTNLNMYCPGKVTSSEVVNIFSILGCLSRDHRIGVCGDTLATSRVLMCCDLPNHQHISQYLIKPAEEITAQESLCFSSSILSGVIPDRVSTLFSVGMEGTAEPLSQDETAEIDQGTPTEDDPTGGVSEESDPLDDPSSPIQPGEDPARMAKIGRMVMELATSDESLADYLYKQAVLSRIRDIVANPPTRLPTDGIIFLKRWASSWINLLNVKSIKAFVASLSFNLMDITLASDTPIGD